MKLKKTFTIDEKVWEKFEEISSRDSINKSLFIENCLKNLIKKYDSNERNNIKG